MARVLLLMVPSLGLVKVARAWAKPYPGSCAHGNLNGGSDPPAGTAAVLVHVPTSPLILQVQPLPPPLDTREPVAYTSNSTWVVPELAAVPVFRTVTVHVPLGSDDGPAFCCATNGDPPSLTDMIMSTADEAADAEAGAGPIASWAAHTQAKASAPFVALARPR